MGRNKFTTKMQRKLVVLFLLVLLAFAGLSARLILINRDKGESYEKQVLSQQQYSSKTIPYKRGEILDSKGTKLAVSEKVYDLVLDCKQMNAKEEYVEPTLQALEDYFGADKAQVRAYAQENPSSQYYVIKKQMTWDEISAYQEMMEDPERTEESANIAGIWFEESYRRVYPNNTLACDVIGFTRSDGVGLYGLEEYYNDTLSGVNGRQYGYLDTDENLQRTTRAAVDGYSIYSTIDTTIQGIVEKYLKKYDEENRNVAREGNGAFDAACIVMEVNTGNVLAMASYPFYDLNDIRNTEPLIGSRMIDVSGNSTDTVITAEIAESMEDDNDLLMQNLNALWKNYCISSTFEPGSTMKPFVAAMGLEDGRLKGNESFECTGIMEVGGYNIRCHNYLSGAEGWLTIGESIERSCNVALIRMAQVIGTEEFLKYMEEFNFGLKTNIDLAGEARTASLVFNENTMGPTELATSSFGQGFNVTMIEMITGFCALINGGYYYEPHMVSRITASDGSVVENIEPRVLKQVISSETSAKVREYCEQVIYGENGTGWRARTPGYRIGGKTGTAETVSAQGTREKDEYVVSFLGYAPADDPQIAVYVVLNRPNSQNQDLETGKAALMARNIFCEVLPYLNIFMTEPLTEDDQKILDDLQIEIRQQLESGVGEDGGEETVSGNGAAGEGGENAGEAGENPPAEESGPADESGESEPENGGQPENGEPEENDNPYVNDQGQVIDPDTGQVITPEDEGYETPVSTILGGTGVQNEGDSGGEAESGGEAADGEE
ncbi:MAG TPA: cell division protein FtsI [Candidatus Eisenbergiella merdigallinarum]|uniref:Cell division protein FtsI n=1 Tax=Candidatus Eisenbergiella merdigallinarum TaxID=2838552 RepID=A0A9D2MQD6_9FIRM|nr:cell division protein FtsI [Candidatus Eisenbergiella merdigallinarum]